MRGPVVIGGDNLPSLVEIGLTDPANIGGGAVAPLAPPVPASLYIIKHSVSAKMFTNERLFTIQAFTIARVHCSLLKIPKELFCWLEIL